MSLSFRLSYTAIFLLIVGLLGSGFYLEYFEGLIPCPLCTLQRFAYAGIGIMAFLGILVSRKRFARVLVDLLMMLFAITGFTLAARQTWIQLFPSPDNTECGVSLGYMLDILPWHEVAAKVFAGSAECTDKTWSFLTLTMAEWSVICFAFFFCASAFLLIKEWRERLG